MDLTKQKVSIALCVFNGEDSLRGQLDSIAMQTRRPDELIVCDDGSEDRTLEIIADFAKTVDFPIRINVNKSHLGITKNFQKAVELCVGDIIFLSDQDDFWFSKKIDTVCKVFSENPEAGYVFSDAWVVNQELLFDGTLWARVGFLNKRYAHFSGSNQFESLFKSNFIYGNTLAFRGVHKKVLIPFDSKSSDFTHDVWISRVLSGADIRGIGIQDCLICYRQHSRQVASAGAYFKKSFFEKVQAVLRETRAADSRAELICDLKSLKSRLCKVSPHKISNIKYLDELIMHLEHRNVISSIKISRFYKFKLVLEETLRGRYKRFSSSCLSALLDSMLCLGF